MAGSPKAHFNWSLATAAGDRPAVLADWDRVFASASALQPFHEGAEASFLTGGLLEQPLSVAAFPNAQSTAAQELGDLDLLFVA